MISCWSSSNIHAEFRVNRYSRRTDELYWPSGKLCEYLEPLVPSSAPPVAATFARPTLYMDMSHRRFWKRGAFGFVQSIFSVFEDFAARQYTDSVVVGHKKIRISVICELDQVHDVTGHVAVLCNVMMSNIPYPISECEMRNLLSKIQTQYFLK